MHVAFQTVSRQRLHMHWLRFCEVSTLSAGLDKAASLHRAGVQEQTAS